MEHSKTLEETKLWQKYIAKTSDESRRKWTKEAYYSACEQLKAVRDTFENYTLHDETHVLNVLDAMAGLLGNRIDDLTVGEVELLIIVSAFHDLGMVYTAEERENYLSDSDNLRAYYSSNPDMRGKDIADWDKIDKQNYWRWLHPFRVNCVLQQSYWQTFFANQPEEMASENVIISVCRAHGDSPDVIRRGVTEPKGNLKYQRYKDIDPLFCAILLRLADILDFDDSRAPSVLFSYSGNNSKSVEEWKKHKSSMGFNYPDTPSSKELPYGARFTDPTIERAANRFLDWIDEELSNSRNLLLLTNERWNHFVFPYQVDRSEIDRIGYDYGDFKITMDQDKILELLVGENLYSDPSVFVRELLQNAIDATLTRAEMDSEFAEKINTDEARIDLWEWWDEQGDLWFRIDDFGTGMTRGMLEKYFLKAGNSYYNSKEFKRDLNGKSFISISRFGIGFLSSFLCGEEAFVSTKYWNPEKNIREVECDAELRKERNEFGLRLDVVGLNEYYTLKNQAILDNHPNPLPAPPINCPRPYDNLEKNGYRNMPGTSIAIRIDTGKLGSISLIDAARHWTMYPHMPIYYNGIRLCMTFDEIITLAKEEQGVKEYELSDEEKKKYDSFLPELSGIYPKIRETVNLLETNDVFGLPNLKAILLDTKVMVPKIGRLQRDGWEYAYTGDSPVHEPRITIFGGEENGGNLILPFQSKDNRKIYDVLLGDDALHTVNYGWKGITALQEQVYSYRADSIVIIDDDNARPVMKANRGNETSISMKTAALLIVWLAKCCSTIHGYAFRNSDFSTVSLKEWRAILTSDFCDWAELSTWYLLADFKDAFENNISNNNSLLKELSTLDSLLNFRNITCDIRWILFAYLQMHYRILVNYSENRLVFCKLENTHMNNRFDLFPIMPFCYGDTSVDCLTLCSADPKLRIAITADHPFTIWLLENSEKLREFYPRQFDQIIFGLRNYDANELIGSVAEIITQISKNSIRHGIDTSNCPNLTMDDFKFFTD
ncbi:MAG: ATP-binding protein [Saccharofermentans sp.]|nr:ATP-binding protein [Saccharofermentans sp.]